MENKKKWIFIGYAVLVLLIPAYIIGSSEDVLNNGKLYKFQMEGYDPFDFFRGNFLRVRIDTDNIPTEKEDWLPGETVYLSIDVDEEGFAYFDEALAEPPGSGDYMVSRVNRMNTITQGFTDFFLSAIFGRSRRDRRNRNTVDVEMPNNLVKYFINEEFAEDGEYAIRRSRRFSTVHVRVKNGNVRLQDIYIGKHPIMKYLEEGGDEDFGMRPEIEFQF